MDKKRGFTSFIIIMVLTLLAGCQPPVQATPPLPVTLIPMHINTLTPVPEPSSTPTDEPLSIPTQKEAPMPTLEASLATPKNQPSPKKSFLVDNLVGVTYNSSGDQLIVVDKDSIFFYYPAKMSIAKSIKTGKIKGDPLEFGSTETFSFDQSDDRLWLALGQWAHYNSTKGDYQHGQITALQPGSGLTIVLGGSVNPYVMAAPFINVRFSQDNKYVAGEMDTKHDAVQVWDLKDNLLYTLGVFDGLRNMVFSPKEDRLAFCSTSGQLEIHEISTNKFVASLGKYSSDLSTGSCGLAYSHYGNLLAYYGDDQLINLWDTNSTNLIRHLPTPGGALVQILISPNEQHIATLGTNGYVSVWGINDHQEIFAWGDESSPITSLTYSPDGHYLVGSDTKGNLLVWTPTKNEYTARILGKKIIFSPDNNNIITTTEDGQLLFWQVSSLENGD